MQRRWLLLAAWMLGAWLLVGCGAAIPDHAKTTVLSLQGLDCAGCLEKLAKDLKAQPGVYDTSMNRRRAEVAVVAEPSFDALTKAKELSKGEEFELVLGSGKGSYLPWAKTPDGAD